LSGNDRIAPWVINLSVDTLLIEAVVSDATLVVVTLIVGDATLASFVFVALSEPLGLISRAEGAVILGEEGRIVGARSVFVSASAS